MNYALKVSKTKFFAMGIVANYFELDGRLEHGKLDWPPCHNRFS